MDNLQIIFVDHPDVDPCEEDNPVCAQTCVVRARYRDDGGCFLTDMPTLRYAILCGYTEKRNETAYPAAWLDERTLICRKGHAFLRRDGRGQGNGRLRTANRGHTTRRESVMSLFDGFKTMRLVKVGPSLGERLERLIAAWHHRAVVARLRRFRRMLEQEMAPEPWTVLEASVVLLLSDMCDALRLMEEERAHVLGPDGERMLVYA
jgi:hypothetical protein